jgi:adenine-specific DNA methylase
MSFVAPLSPNGKDLGAYYTATNVAEFIVRWAIRSPSERIFDPSFGGGVFLDAACRQIKKMGGNTGLSVFGAELDPSTFGRTFLALQREYGVPKKNLIRGDFFSLQGIEFALDAIVGNPPFIRYQRFSGPSRDRAIEVASAAGVKLSELCSSWAPFVVHSANLLQPHGRLGFVVPSEIMHAAYARPVLDFLTRIFSQLTFLTFRQRLFPDINQDTLLLLAEDKNPGTTARIKLREINDAQELAGIPTGDGKPMATRNLSLANVIRGTDRFLKHLLPKKVQGLYDDLSRHPKVLRLGQIADVGIGYVTGGNDFFHLTKAAVAQWDIPKEYLRLAVCRGRALDGLRLTCADWERLEKSGDAAFLLHIRDQVPSAHRGLSAYIQHGEAAGIHQTFKCRTRTPWYRVPHVHLPDAFLAYMSGLFPRLVVNQAAAVAPNTLHVVRIHPLAAIEPQRLAIGWQSSLTHLSAEIEGHAMGGGMLKLEPTEAARVLVALPDGSTISLSHHTEILDLLLRNNQADAVQAAVDRMILIDAIGLSVADCKLLRQTTQWLRSRRMPRGVRHVPA